MIYGSMLAHMGTYGWPDVKKTKYKQCTSHQTHGNPSHT